MLKTYRKNALNQRDEKLERQRFEADSGNGISGEFTRFRQMEKGIGPLGAGNGCGEN